jgi:membrane-bound lytic murein transglycosylase D
MRGVLLGWIFLATVAVAAEPPKQAAPADEPALDVDALYEQGKAWFDELAPAEVKRHFEFPRREQFNDFTRRFQRALESNNLDELASYAPEARAALVALRRFPGYHDYADWLAERLDYAEAAEQAKRQPAPKPPTKPVRGYIPHYELWLARLKARPVPPRAAELLPQVRAVFAEEGVPADLAWLAEAESTFNPAALSPAGAKGLFQLMPATARELGLSAALPDERADPEKNARAAARYLKQLHARFRDWPLVLAAYNAGPGRVRRTLDARQAKTFSEIAAALPVETRMYVPKVLATLAVRAGVGVGDLPPPR